MLVYDDICICMTLCKYDLVNVTFILYKAKYASSCHYLKGLKKK